jgi:DNA repair protein SbcD/Mre11
MRLLHTADWHLGRLFHKVHLTADQAVVTQRLVELVEEERPDVVIVAGDLYDRAVPGTDAVELLDHVLSELVLRLAVPVVAIAGNHDSPSRIGFAAGLLRERGLHLVGLLPAEAQAVVLADEHGPVHIHPLPFADPAEARAAFSEPDIHDQQAVLSAAVARALAATPVGERRVAVAHAFVAGGLVSESERPISVGGAGAVAAATFDGFDYTALGHLHRPQRAGATARYAGSLMKYSFSEHDHAKSVSLVEIGPPGSAGGTEGDAGRARVIVTEHPLRPPRDAPRLEGTLDELVTRGRTDPGRDDYICATLTDTGALLDPMGRLREAYPNALAIELPESVGRRHDERLQADPRRGDAELFADFFRQVTGEPPGEAQAAAFAGVVDGLRRREREAGR